MGKAYTPGLRVSKKTVVRKERILPLKGNVIKKVGDKITRDEVVARTELPGNVKTMNVVNLLGIQPNEIEEYMLKKVGEKFEKGEVIAESKSFISWFKSKINAPVSGSIETISTVTGQVLLREPPKPIEVHGYLDGTVVDVIDGEGVVVESVATFIQGIFGIGGEVWGPLKFAVNSSSEVLDPEKIDESYKGAVIVGGAFASHAAINKAISVGAVGLIAGGIHDEDLRNILGYDLGVAITGTEKVGITLLVTEGFGEIAMSERSFNTLKEREGEIASISGATQIRAGVIRPEIIIPYDDNQKDDLVEDGGGPSELKLGAQLRVIRQPYFGRIGVVHSIPHELRQIDSETHARVVEVKFDDSDEAVTVPRANVEMIAK